MTYTLTSHISSQPVNILMANVNGGSGDSRLSIKPISQVIIIDFIPTSTNETFINLSSIDHDFTILSIWFLNAADNDINDNIVFRVYDENTLIRKISDSANSFSGGKDFFNKPLPIRSKQKISVQSTFIPDKLTLVIEPIIILQQLQG